MIPPNAMIAPTDRSIPPLRMTKSMPRLISPFVTIWRAKLIKFDWVKKLSDESAAVTRSTTKSAMKA